jgi:hypothetical protein
MKISKISFKTPKISQAEKMNQLHNLQTLLTWVTF